LIDGIFNQAYPTRRFQRAWMGLITHTLPSFVIIGVVLSLVLGQARRARAGRGGELVKGPRPQAFYEG
jgi:hypothetical protein